MITTTYTTLNDETLNTIKSELISGCAVGVPTETVYGLAVNGLSEKAVSDLYELKGRPEIKPISLMVPDFKSVYNYAHDIPGIAEFLANRFWPGPLTIILKANTDLVPEVLRAGGSTLGFRCPKHEDTLKLLNSIDFPLAVPSANPSGFPSAITSKQVVSYFDEKIPSVIDGGECVLSLESTVLSLAQTPYKIYREASLSEDVINKAYFDYAHIIGITGPTGSGKSFVAKQLLNDVEESNKPLLIDCDQVYHELLVNDTELNEALISEFPQAEDSGKINRKLLAKFVFNSDERLARLNEITHPFIMKKLRSLIIGFVKMGGKTVYVDAPTLIESGFSDLCSEITVVIADKETRLKRIMQRDGITIENALSRINAQHDDDFYIGRATKVIENN